MNMPTNNKFDHAVIGNNTAALVTALSLPQSSCVVLINPTPVWGAHFGSSIINGEHFDIGMNFFEFTSFAEGSDDIRSYNVDVRNDSARFFHLVEKFVQEHVDVLEAPTPQMLTGELQINDLIIANDLSGIQKLNAGVRSKIIEELQLLVTERGELHASNKKKNEQLFSQQSYYKVSVANHGETFHQLFIEPICQKILSISSQIVPALYHRVAWAPLFYPETLLAYFAGEKVALPKTIFHYPANGHFSTFVEAVLEKVKQRKNVTIIQNKIAGITNESPFIINIEGAEPVTANKLAWAMDLNAWAKLAQNTSAPPASRASLVLAFINLNSANVKNHFSTLFITDLNEPIYRITNQTFCAGLQKTEQQVIVEINHDHFIKCGLNYSEEAVIKLITDKFISLGLIKNAADILKITVKAIMNALVLPTFENLEHFNELYGEVIKNKDQHLTLMANSSGFSTGSLNDQIVQGLKAGADH